MPRLETIIVLLRDRVACATFGARSTIKKFVTLARTDVDEPNVAVVAALGALGEKLGEVAVLSTDCATHTLELPASSVLGLSAEAVEQAVAFEAEPLSGMNAGEAAVALQTLPSVPGRSRVWVTMATYQFRDTIESAISAFGGRLAVLTHPGGLPTPLRGDAVRGVDWRRVEFWRGQVIRLAASGKTLTIRTDEEGVSINDPAATQAEWRRLHPIAASEESLYEVAEAMAVDEHAGEFSLEDEAALQRWLSAWHGELSVRAPRVPVQRFARPPLTSRQRTMIALVLALVTFAACYGHHQFVSRGIDAARAEQAIVEAPGKELATLKTKSTELATAITKDQAAERQLRSDVENFERVLVGQRERLADLLRRLSERTHHKWLLREIQGTGQDFKVIGVTLDPQHIGDLTNEIAEQVRPYGWSAEPPQHKSAKLSGELPHWEFELKLRDVLGPRRPAATAPANPVPPKEQVTAIDGGLN
ncbi:MAG: hypothetical protein JNM18_01250 [Planctomycetaceae bacterium]|nr:hypothetical protein [Planctomycetaceae bacterium]